MCAFVAAALGFGQGAGQARVMPLLPKRSTLVSKKWSSLEMADRAPIRFV
jgi:hypothetical protein